MKNQPITLSAVKLTTKDEQSRHTVVPFSMYVSMENLWGKSLMLVFAFTQIFFYPVYKLDSKTPLLSPVHAQKCNIWLMCGK